MLTRRREQMFLILGLVALNALLGWKLTRLASDYRDRTRWIYAAVPSQRPLLSPSSSSPTSVPQSFTQIVDRNVFSPERTNQSPQPEDLKVPPLPLLFGTMNLGDGWFALMASGDETSPASRQILPGGEIGGFKLVSIGVSDVVVQWRDQKFTVDVSESARRVPRIVEKTASANGRPAPAPTTAAARTNPVAAVAASGSSAGGAQSAPPGTWSPPGVSPDAPVGTIAGGRQKVIVPTPFGPRIEWQLVAPQSGANTSTPPQ